GRGVGGLRGAGREASPGAHRRRRGPFSLTGGGRGAVRSWPGAPYRLLSTKPKPHFTDEVRMIGPLVRWFGRAAPRRSRRDAGPARRFTPRLEVLEGRALPAVLFGAGAPVGVTAQAAPLVADVGGGAHVVTVLGTNGGGDGLSGGTEVTPFGVRIGTTGT